MDISVRVMLDVSPKLEELVFHVLATVATGKENNIIVAEPVPMKTKQQETVAKPQKIVAKPQETEAKADIPGKEVPKAEAEKLKEVADLQDTAELTEADIVSLRKKVVAFVQQDAEKNKQIFADWLQSHGLTKITDINTKALAAELEGAISA